MPRGELSPKNNRSNLLLKNGDVLTVQIDFSKLVKEAVFRQWSIRGFRLKFINMDLPSYVLNVDPSIPPVDYLAMLLDMGHVFRLPSGERLSYNGYDLKGHVLFSDRSRKTYRFTATLEWRFFTLKKILYALTLYFSTPISLARTAEFFNLSRNVVEEAVRFFNEPSTIVIDGETMTVRWGGESVLVVFVDGTRGGGRGLIVTASGRREVYRYGVESSDEVINGVADYIIKLGEELGASKYLIIMDGNRGVAERFLARFGSKAIIVEHSHSNWWEICVIYYHRGEWYTVRTRGDVFAEEKTSRPDIDLPPSHIEVYRGIVHVGYVQYAKREARYIESWRSKLAELIRELPCAVNYGKRAFREYMAWWVTRVNQLTRALNSRKVDLTGFKEALRTAFENTVKKLEKQGEEKLKVLKKALAEVKLLQEHEESKARRRNTVAKSRNKRVRRRRISRRKKELVYRGHISKAPKHALKVLKLLKIVFRNKHITSSRIEGLIGVYVHSLRNSRGRGKVLRKLGHMRRPIWANFRDISAGLKLGRGPRNNRPRLRRNKTYLIIYRDRYGNTTTRKITVLEIKKRLIKAYCHLRKQVRTFKRSRIISIKPA